MQQSVSLLQVKDPLFKRMGASRLARFAIDGNVSLCDSLILEMHVILKSENLGMLWCLFLHGHVNPRISF